MIQICLEGFVTVLVATLLVGAWIGFYVARWWVRRAWADGYARILSRFPSLRHDIIAAFMGPRQPRNRRD
jgi:hypothetical protein